MSRTREQDYGWQMREPLCQHIEAGRTCRQAKVLVRGLLLCPVCDKAALLLAARPPT